ncbi:hypothetical protein CO181_00175 [candidate division WWE3 bacterium CG_4_9_14_3_um_filter_43_9]|uniref:Uncharacterized protein n=1 Tax=candidate division WWE3 bacterium CG_4_9_14_3_um_filter_43_9 TaxID=1975082 RepID=A0A2M7WZ31_UNCKA|nr:MAG: hypothetical protein CO181_00175 [candidate division WWE3 bacterium CG_4_9_14_3_um_filter_43_9]
MTLLSGRGRVADVESADLADWQPARRQAGAHPPIRRRALTGGKHLTGPDWMQADILFWVCRIISILL